MWSLPCGADKDIALSLSDFMQIASTTKCYLFIVKSKIHFLTLRLHYVPGDHGSHGSPKRSAPCDLVNFCLGTQVLLSIITFRHGLSRYP